MARHADAGPWKLTLLGGFHLTSKDDIRPRLAFYERKQDLLLAYIALDPGIAHRRAAIAGTFWPRHEESEARNRLTEVLFRLRRDLEEVQIDPEEIVWGDKHSIRLAPSVATDLEELHEVVGRVQETVRVDERHAFVEEGLRMAAGGLLPGVDAEWLVEPRAQLEAELQVLRHPERIPSGGYRATHPSGAGVPLLEELTELREVHAERVAALADQAEEGLWTADRASWVDRLTELDAEIEAALEWSLNATRSHLAARIVAGLWQYWYLSGAVSTGREHLEAVIATRQSGTGVVDAQALQGAGSLAMVQGDLVLARTRLEAALDIWKTRGDDVRVARAVGALGTVEHSAGNLDRARGLLEQSRRILESTDGTPPQLLAVLENLGLVEIEAGDYDAAQSLLVHRLELTRRAGNRVAEARVLVDMSSLAQRREDWPEAIRLAQEALREFQAEGDRWGMSFAIRCLAYSSQQGGDISAARAYYEQGLQVARSLSDMREVGDSLRCLAELAADENDTQEARRLYREAGRMLESAGDAGGVREVRRALDELG